MSIGYIVACISIIGLGIMIIIDVVQLIKKGREHKRNMARYKKWRDDFNFPHY